MALWLQKFWAEVFGQSYWEFGREINNAKWNVMKQMKKEKEEERPHVVLGSEEMNSFTHSFTHPMNIY